MWDTLDIPQFFKALLSATSDASHPGGTRIPRYKKREEYEQMLRLVSKYRKDQGGVFVPRASFNGWLMVKGGVSEVLQLVSWVSMEDFKVGTWLDMFGPSQQFPTEGFGHRSRDHQAGTPERHLQTHRGAIRDEGQLEKGRALLR